MTSAKQRDKETLLLIVQQIKLTNNKSSLSYQETEKFSFAKTSLHTFSGKTILFSLSIKTFMTEHIGKLKWPQDYLFLQILLFEVIFVILLMSEMYYNKQQHNTKKMISNGDK